MAFRSRLEGAVSEMLTRLGVDHDYEANKLGYTLHSEYLPDFKLANGIFLEVKGWFSPADRRKMLAVIRDNPGIDIRMVFSNPNQRISKTSKTSYAAWCRKHGILYCPSHSIPESWLQLSPKSTTSPKSSLRSTRSSVDS